MRDLSSWERPSYLLLQNDQKGSQTSSLPFLSRVKFVSIPEPEQLGSKRTNLTLLYFALFFTNKKSSLDAMILSTSNLLIVRWSSSNLFQFFQKAWILPQALYYASCTVLFPGAEHASITSYFLFFHLLSTPLRRRQGGRALLKLCMTQADAVSILSQGSLVSWEQASCSRWYILGMSVSFVPFSDIWCEQFVKWG